MSLVRGRKESKLVRSLVLYVKLGVRLARRLAARVPSLKLHIPFISTLRISFSFIRLRACTLQQTHNLATIYIISFPGDVSTSLNMTIGCGCPTRVITREQSDRGNPADRRTHQADNLAKLRQEFFILA